jgi:phage tail sheath protein FI
MALSNLTTPGVYVQEISTLPPSVAQVSTAIPGFFGYTEKGPLNSAKRVTSLIEFEATFGGAFKEQYQADIAVDSSLTVTDISLSPVGTPPNPASPYTLYYHMQMYFANGGGPCYIIAVNHYDYASPAIVPADFITAPDGIFAAEKVDEITLLLVPEAINIDTGLNTDADIASLHNTMLVQCNKLKDRFTIMDVKDSGDPNADSALFRNDNVGTNYLNYGAAYYPTLNTILKRRYLDGEVVITDARAGTPYNAEPNNRLATILTGIGTFSSIDIGTITASSALTVTINTTTIVLTAGIDIPVGGDDADVIAALNNNSVFSSIARAQASTSTATRVLIVERVPDPATTIAFPTPPAWATNPGADTDVGIANSQDVALYNSIKTAINALNGLTLPPSATMAGIYAAVDSDRGVWKAPANVSVTNISGPSIMITDAQQGDLNIDPSSGKSINAIRSFVGRGTLVWGARTLEGNSNEWRYVPVRRLFIMMEESIKKASEFVVFEPNDKNTWLRVTGTINNFLNGLWQQGALAGAKPEDAYFVKVGLGETMTAQDILEGRLIILIGVAAVRPAEFIILQFEHKLQES